MVQPLSQMPPIVIQNPFIVTRYNSVKKRIVFVTPKKIRRKLETSNFGFRSVHAAPTCRPFSVFSIQLCLKRSFCWHQDSLQSPEQLCVDWFPLQPSIPYFQWHCTTSPALHSPTCVTRIKSFNHSLNNMFVHRPFPEKLTVFLTCSYALWSSLHS